MSFLIGVVIFLAQVISFALLIYCVMSFVMPQSEVFGKISAYVEPILRPFRELLYKYFPKLRSLGVDFSPLAVWLVLEVAVWLLGLLRRIF